MLSILSVKSLFHKGLRAELTELREQDGADLGGGGGIAECHGWEGERLDRGGVRFPVRIWKASPGFTFPRFVKFGARGVSVARAAARLIAAHVGGVPAVPPVLLSRRYTPTALHKKFFSENA